MWLCDLSIVNLNWCDTCKIPDTIGHYIYSCASAKLFWSKLEKWWNTASIHPVVLTEKHVIFGLFYDLIHLSSINYVILLGKMYIYRQKMNEKEISFKYFLIELNFKLDVEKAICELNNTITFFNKKWVNIFEAL